MALSNNTAMIDTWLNMASNAPFSIETQWSDDHAKALAERIHDAITAPTAGMLSSLGLLLLMAENNAKEGLAGQAGSETSTRAIAQLEFARTLVETLSLNIKTPQQQQKVQTLFGLVGQDEHRAVLQSLFDAQDNGGLSMAGLRATSQSDVFSLRKQVKLLCDEGVLETHDSSGASRYTLSEDAWHVWCQQNGMDV